MGKRVYQALKMAISQWGFSWGDHTILQDALWSRKEFLAKDI